MGNSRQVVDDTGDSGGGRRRGLTLRRSAAGVMGGFSPFMDMIGGLIRRLRFQKPNFEKYQRRQILKAALAPTELTGQPCLLHLHCLGPNYRLTSVLSTFHFFMHTAIHRVERTCPLQCPR